MNLQENIRSILREEKDQTKLIKGIIDSSDIFNYKYFCGVDIIRPEEKTDQFLIKVYFVGGPNSKVWPRTQAVRNKEYDLIEELFEYIKSFVPFNIEMMASHVNSCDGYNKLMKRKYSTDNLQESIIRILKEEDYSPAGKEVIPNKIVIHKSNPMSRDKIMENGLKVRAGECYKIYVGYGVKCKPAIFATNSTNKRSWFDSTYDDDIWEINTTMIPDVKWFKDKHFESRSKHIVTFQDIPKEAITLKYEGTGSSEDILNSWPEDSPNKLQEQIRKVLREEVNRNEFNDSFTGVTPTDTTQQLINKPVKLIGDVNTNTIIQNVNVNRDGSVNIEFQNGLKLNSSLPNLRKINFGVSIPLEFKVKKQSIIFESENKTKSALHKLLNVLFDGFDNIDYNWANYMCGMGECCDPYAIGFTLPESDYDYYIFKLVDGNKYDDHGDYPKEFRDELPEVCYEQPNLKNPDFDTIVFYEEFAEEVKDYMGHESNWGSDLLKIINNQFGCEAKRIIII
jgi:hypothetical protein